MITPRRNPSNFPPSFEDLVKQLFEVKKKVDNRLKILKEDADTIEAYYEPRAEFERWTATQKGKDWKEQQYKHQKGCCALCQKAIELKGSHIDHEKPISKFPKLNLDPSNMRVTCPICNVTKGDKFVDLS
jgi:5-methylcytosine-specific restriction endonuclease McrA